MKFDDKAIAKSRQRIGIIVKVITVVVDYILKTNAKLDKGIHKAEASKVFHNEAISKALDSIDKASHVIDKHKEEIEKNNRLLKKFEDFIN